MKRRIAALCVLFVGVGVGLTACGGTTHNKPVPTVNCVGDHDNDCPQGEKATEAQEK